MSSRPLLRLRLRLRLLPGLRLLLLLLLRTSRTLSLVGEGSSLLLADTAMRSTPAANLAAAASERGSALINLEAGATATFRGHSSLGAGMTSVMSLADSNEDAPTVKLGGQVKGVDAARMRSAAEDPMLLATDLAEVLVREGVPFRDAHGITGAVVKRAEEQGIDLADLPLAEMQAIDPRITDDVFGVLSVEASVASRTSFGGTAPDNVRAAVADARARFTGG